MNYKKILVVAFLIVVIGVFTLITQQPDSVGASVQRGSEYMATSTVNDTTNLTIADNAIIKLTPGSLGRITITAVGTAPLTFYDATTTDVTKRTGNVSTSSLTVVKIPASLAVGTYDYDMELKYGLVIKVGAGTVATSTILYR